MLVAGKPELRQYKAIFANTEGGELILGVREEKKGNTRVATAINGVPATLGSARSVFRANAIVYTDK